MTKDDDCRRRDGMTKTSFKSRHKARTRARQLGQREYHCPNCGLYHLSKSAINRENQMLNDIEEPVPLPETEGEDRRRSKYRLDYGGEFPVEVLAFTAVDAVKLAGRGRPLQITNVTAVEERWPGIVHTEDET